MRFSSTVNERKFVDHFTSFQEYGDIDLDRLTVDKLNTLILIAWELLNDKLAQGEVLLPPDHTPDPGVLV